MGWQHSPRQLAHTRAEIQHACSANASRPSAWLQHFFPGYFALVMGTGIIAVGAHLLQHVWLSWALFLITLLAYPVLWLILLARTIRFPGAVIADFVSHERGPAFLTIVAANGVLGTQFDVFNTLTGLLPALFWFSLGLWFVLVYGFLAAVTLSSVKPELEHGLNGAWLLLVVATESLSILGCLLAQRTGAAPFVFLSIAFHLLGLVLYLLLSTLIFLRWTFSPMHAAHMAAPWWINMGAAAIATLAGAHLMALSGAGGSQAQLLALVAPFTLLLWATSTFWIPLLVILFGWKALQRGSGGYDPGLWSAVFPLGMYVVATYDYATVAGLPFLAAVSDVLFWFALLVWALTFIGMCLQPLRLARWRSNGT